MITYEWDICFLDCAPVRDGNENVVGAIHWRLHGTDGTYQGSVYGAHPVEYDSEAEFIAFEELSEETVIEWLENAIGTQQVDKYKEVVAAEIDRQANPPVVTLPVPWGN